MNYAYTGRTGGRQTSIQFTNRILFFISSSYHKILVYLHITQVFPRLITRTVPILLGSTSHCQKLFMDNRGSKRLHADNAALHSCLCLHGCVPVAPLNPRCHRWSPSIHQMTVFSRSQPSCRGVIYTWLCPPCDRTTKPNQRLTK